MSVLILGGRRALGLLWLLVAVFSIAATQVNATPQWVETADLSPVGADSLKPKVAMNANGDAVAVWSRAGEIQASYRKAGDTAWGTAVALSGSGANEPDVAIDPVGRAVAVWTRSDGSNTRIESSTRGANTSAWYPATAPLSDAGQDANDADVEVDGSGNATVVWHDFGAGFGVSYVIYSRYHPVNGDWEASELLSVASPAGHDAEGPDLAVNASGQAVVAWSYYDGADTTIQAQVRNGTTWSPGLFPSVPATLSSTPGVSTKASVAIDPSGRSTVVWERDDGGDQRIQAATTAVGTSTSWVANEFLSNSTPGRDAVDPSVAVDESGRTTVIWAAQNSSLYSNIQSVVRPAGSTAWGAISTISTDVPYNATLPTLSIDSVGYAVAAWVRSDGSNPLIQAVTRIPGAAGWSDPTNISVAGLDASTPHVASDNQGNAVAVFSRSNGSNLIVEARGFDRTGPVVDTFLTPSGTVGSPVSFYLKATDLWSAFDISWNFGDGTTGTGTSPSHTYSSAGDYGVTVTVTDTWGNATSATQTASISAASSGGGGGSGGGTFASTGADAGTGGTSTKTTITKTTKTTPPVSTRPVISNATLVTRRLSSIRQLYLKGAVSIKYGLSETAKVQFRLLQKTKKSKKSKKKTKTKFRTLGKFTVAGKKGKNKTALPTKVSKKLRRGVYYVELTAVNSAGQKSVSRRVRINIRRN